MRARFRVGLHGKTYVGFEAAYLEAKQRGRRLHLVVGTRAVLELPATFTLVERIGHLVYHEHTSRRGGELRAGPGWDTRGHLSTYDPVIYVNHNNGEVDYRPCPARERQEVPA